MPYSSLQRLIIVARKQLNLPAASIHSLRHSFATHLLIDFLFIFLLLTIRHRADRSRLVRLTRTGG